MARYIDADALINKFVSWLPEDPQGYLKENIRPIENIAVSAIMEIEEAPTADVAPVVHGEWIDNLNCSECGVLKRDDRDWIYNFCPNCGADMRKAVE